MDCVVGAFFGWLGLDGRSVENKKAMQITVNQLMAPTKRARLRKNPLLLPGFCFSGFRGWICFLASFLSSFFVFEFFVVVVTSVEANLRRIDDGLSDGSTDLMIRAKIGKY